MSDTYLDRLLNQNDIFLSYESLKLTSNTGTLEFVKAKHASFASEKWSLQYIIQHKTLQEAPMQDGRYWFQHEAPEIFLQIEGDQILGHGGCNEFDGHVLRNEDNLKINISVRSANECVEESQNLENQFFAMLNRVNRFEIDRKVLTFYNAEELEIARFNLMDKI